MDKIEIKKDQLREIVEKNAAAHRGIFLEAMEGFRRRAQQELEKRLNDIRNGRNIQVFINLPKPEDHTKDYNRVIRMIDLSVGNTMELTQQEFAQYVMDDWTWKNAWITSNSAYSDTAAAMVADGDDPIG